MNQNNYPIAISGDVGSLGDYVSSFSKQTPAVRVASGVAVGTLAGHFAGKHGLIGALIGAAAGYIAGGWNSQV